MHPKQQPFSEITQPKDCNAVNKTTEYMCKILPICMSKLEKFFKTKVTVGKFELIGCNCIGKLSATDAICGLFQVDTSSCIPIHDCGQYYICPPNPIDLCTAYTKYYCREPECGDVIQVVISNKTDKNVSIDIDCHCVVNGVSFHQEPVGVRTVLPLSSTVYWLIFKSCDEYVIYRPSYDN